MEPITHENKQEENNIEVVYTTFVCSDAVKIKIPKDLALCSKFVSITYEGDKTAEEIPVSLFSSKIIKDVFFFCENIDYENKYIPDKAITVHLPELKSYMTEGNLPDVIINIIPVLTVLDIKHLMYAATYLDIPETLKFLVQIYAAIFNTIFTNVPVKDKATHNIFIKRIKLIQYLYDNVQIKDIFNINYDTYCSIYDSIDAITQEDLTRNSYKNIYNQLLKCAIQINNAHRNKVLILDDTIKTRINNMNKLLDILETYLNTSDDTDMDDLLSRHIINTSLKPLIKEIKSNDYITNLNMDKDPVLIFPESLVGLFFNYLTIDTSLYMLDYVKHNIDRLLKHITHFNTYIIYKSDINETIIPEMPPNVNVVILNNIDEIDRYTNNTFIDGVRPKTYDNVKTLVLNYNIHMYDGVMEAHLVSIFPNVTKLIIYLYTANDYDDNYDDINIFTDAFSMFTTIREIELYTNISPININNLQNNSMLESIHIEGAILRMDDTLDLLKHTLSNVRYIKDDRSIRKFNSIDEYTMINKFVVVVKDLLETIDQTNGFINKLSIIINMYEYMYNNITILHLPRFVDMRNTIHKKAVELTHDIDQRDKTTMTANEREIIKRTLNIIQLVTHALEQPEDLNT